MHQRFIHLFEIANVYKQPKCHLFFIWCMLGFLCSCLYYEGKIVIKLFGMFVTIFLPKRFSKWNLKIKYFLFKVRSFFELLFLQFFLTQNNGYVFICSICLCYLYVFYFYSPNIALCFSYLVYHWHCDQYNKF